MNKDPESSIGGLPSASARLFRAVGFFVKALVSIQQVRRLESQIEVVGFRALGVKVSGLGCRVCVVLLFLAGCYGVVKSSTSVDGLSTVLQVVVLEVTHIP